MTLKEASIDRKNNLNIIRLVAALMVLYMHSFSICVGESSADIFNLFTFGKEGAGGIAVDIFFIISGFLICRSYDRNHNVWKYIKARFLRIWPLLFVYVILTAFVVGPIISKYTLAQYFQGNITGYLKNLYFNSLDTYLPGVFSDHYNHSLNGSLWTLRYEVIAYIAVVVFSPIWRRRRIFAPVAFVLFAVCHVIYNCYSGIDIGPVSAEFISSMVRLGMFFIMGMCYYLYQDRIVISGRIAIVAFILLIAGMYLADFSIVFALFGSYIIFYLAFQKRFIATWYDKVGDLSYGVYILSFTVQQIVCEIVGTPVKYYLTMSMNPYLNMLISFIIVLPLAWISWHCLEKQCLKLK